MNKLTAEKCRQFIISMKSEQDRNQLSITGGYQLQALEIALPVLEQEGGCNWHYDEADCFWSSECGECWQFTDGGPEDNRVKFCQGCGRPVVLPQTQPTTPQINNDGWIEWDGMGGYPTEAKAFVQTKLRSGHISKGFADQYYWSLPGLAMDIIAYRVIENDGREG